VANADETDDDAVTALEGLRAEPSPDFFPRVRASIERRVLGAHVLELTLESLTEVALQYLAVALESVSQEKGKGEQHD
jgi:hypothetical protein